ncbi:hypothetical protein V5O48_000943 [Marasmius crinis-equi]|uniref:PEHE domain-containing protein n=1 Tax=Marasmius crinis-equi TaxID=585013 RepID=A0ABR3FZQ1_9AGAR
MKDFLIDPNSRKLSGNNKKSKRRSMRTLVRRKQLAHDSDLEAQKMFGIVDTSDAAYERRHKKYETFEKRVRLREKEKLKHEQYKLQERIEQLRAMEYTAFLSLPASNFSPAPGRREHDDPEGPAISSLPGAHVNGAAAMHEAERRRQEMLDVAEALQERYRLLLPPERVPRVRKPNESAGGTPILPASSPPPDITDIHILSKATSIKSHKKRLPDDGESEIDQEDEVMDSDLPLPAPEEKVKLMIRISKKASALNTPTPPVSVSAPVKIDKKPSKKRNKARSEFNGVYSADTPMSSPDIAVLETSASPPKKRHRPNKKQRVAEEARSESVRAASKKPTYQQTRDDLGSAGSLTPVSDAGAPSNSNRHASFIPPIAVLDESVSAPPTRRRGESSRPTQNRSTSAAPRPRPPRAPPKPLRCELVVAAERASIQTVSRRGRNTSAFGYKIPEGVDMELQYELPLWILEDDEFQARYSKYPDATDKLNPDLVMNPKFNPKGNFEDQLVNALNSAKDREASEASESGGEEELGEEEEDDDDGEIGEYDEEEQEEQEGGQEEREGEEEEQAVEEEKHALEEEEQEVEEEEQDDVEVARQEREEIEENMVTMDVRRRKKVRKTRAKEENAEVDLGTTEQPLPMEEDEQMVDVEG